MPLTAGVHAVRTPAAAMKNGILRAIGAAPDLDPQIAGIIGIDQRQNLGLVIVDHDEHPIGRQRRLC